MQDLKEYLIALKEVRTNEKDYARLDWRRFGGRGMKIGK